MKLMLSVVFFSVAGHDGFYTNQVRGECGVCKHPTKLESPDDVVLDCHILAIRKDIKIPSVEEAFKEFGRTKRRGLLKVGRVCKRRS